MQECCMFFFVFLYFRYFESQNACIILPNYLEWQKLMLLWPDPLAF